MKRLFLTLGLAAALAAPGCKETTEHPELQDKSSPPQAAAGDDEDGDEEETEEMIALKDLPNAVRAAALAAVPGLVITEVEKETEGSDVHYCIHGTAGGEFVEVEVSPDGKVGEIERGDEEEDDGEEGG